MADGTNPLNWPPALQVPWPDITSSSIEDLMSALIMDGWTRAATKPADRTAFFDTARCTQNHTVTGTMIVSPQGVRYPFAVCTDLNHREILFLWFPYYGPPPGPLPGS